MVVRAAREEQPAAFVPIAEIARRMEFAFGEFVEAVRFLTDQHVRAAQMDLAVLAYAPPALHVDLMPAAGEPRHTASSVARSR